MLNILVTDAVLFFEVGKSMGKAQVLQTVDLIIDDYKHFKPEDFKLCFRNAMKGHYGKLFDRLDGQIIMEWLMQYDNERDAEIEAIRAKENRELKQAPALGLIQQFIAAADNPEADNFKTNIEKLKQQLAEDKHKRDAATKAKAVQDLDKGPVHAMHQRWMQQFDDLHFLRPVPSKGARFVKRYGRYLDKNGYLQHKQWQYQCIPALREELHKQINKNNENI